LEELGSWFLFDIKHNDEITNLRKIEAGVPQGSVLGPVLYLIYTNDLPTSENTTTATFADDTAILATNEDPAITSIKLQHNINKVNEWAKKLRIKANQNKSTHISFTMRNQTCPIVQMGDVALPQKNDVKYLGVHLDRRLTWARHIKAKRNQLNLKVKKCTGYSERDQHYQLKVNCYYTKQFSNPSVLTAFSYGGQPLIPTLKYPSASNRRL
jgi:hypothetical protein